MRHQPTEPPIELQQFGVHRQMRALTRTVNRGPRFRQQRDVTCRQIEFAHHDQ
jgi:hypothetical protein